jgi:GNAT superfamily N-acetyltransferase
MKNGAKKLRRACPEEAAIVVRHRRGMFRDMGQADQSALDAMEASSLPFFVAAMGDGSYVGWFVENAVGEVVAGGGVLITPWPSNPREFHLRRATILNVYTEPPYRRQGLARRLMEVILDWCRQEAFASVNLHASEFGRPLYEGLGFVATNEMRLTFSKLDGV